MKAKAGIIGATGYTGVVLTTLLLRHPNAEITYLSSEQFAGKYYHEVYPAFYGRTSEKLKEINIKGITKNCDVVFLATPNNFSGGFIPKLLKENNSLKIIDLSADLRLESNLTLKKNEKIKITYGLPEINRSEIKNSQIIVNPGCYPTSAILALTPLVKNNLINLSSIIIDSKSGVSGAGKQPKPELHFSEVNESFAPYNLGGKHRHIPEIEKTLREVASANAKNKEVKDIKITFSPHLLPVTRGILSTIYCDLTKNDLNQKELNEIFAGYYKKEQFVKVLPEGIYANTKNVRHTNYCHLSVLKDERTSKIIIVSAIDNMVKGASGQAIQNMNIILSFKESLGLDSLGQIP